MKIKKGLALILALAMIITLMPTMAFATTTNTVSKVVTVAAEDEMPATTINLETKDAWAKNTAQNIKLTLENATWTDTPAVVADVMKVGIVTKSDTILKEDEEFKIGFVAASKTTLELSITPLVDMEKGANVSLEILDEKMTSGAEAGDVKVTIDGLDSQVSSSTLTIANVATSTTTTAVTGEVKTFPRGNVDDIETVIEIRETAINSLRAGSVQTIKLTLPKGVTWQTTPFNKGGNLTDTPVSGNTDISADGRTVTYTFTVSGNNNTRNVLTITPNINISRDAAEGDIAVSLIGVSGKESAAPNAADVATVTDTSDLIIATYGSESVEVTTEEEVPTIVSGYVTDTKDKSFTVSVTLEETMVDSLADGRYVDFDLPEEVQITGPIKAKVNSDSKNTATDNIEIEGSNNNTADSTKDTSGFAFLVPDENGTIVKEKDWSASKANKVTFEIPVTVEAGFSGDITMNITGAKAGVEDTELVVAKADTPITVETTTTNVKNGVQTQTVADIKITENFAGYIDSDAKTTNNKNDSYILIDIDTLGLSKSMVFESFDNIEVTSGDLEIGKCTINDDQQIQIPIERESTKVSTIELKGLTLALNRTLPEGGYDLNVSGGSIVQNSKYNDDDFSEVAATVEDYVVITTPAENAGINATFTDGQASYTIGNDTVEMDVAPYIDSNNRMLVPIRYAANAMGVSDDNIQWNSYTQTGTISGAMGVVRVTVGSTNLITSNGTITMDTVAVNTNNRIYVPVRYIANALGASVSWDPATRTATFS